MGNTTLVTGGSGYIGALLVEELARHGHEVRVLDSLLHGQEDIAAEQEQAGGAGDPRATSATPTRAGARSTESTTSSISLRSSATPPAGATPRSRMRSTSQATREPRRRRRRGRRAAARVRLDLLQLRAHGRPHRADHRGRRAEPGLAVRRTEGQHGEADPRRRRQQRRTDLPALRHRLRRRPAHALRPDGQRVHARTWADRELEVFGEQFWRPYIHVRDAGRAVRTVLEAPEEKVARQCLQRRPLGRELPQARPRRGDRQADRPRQRLLRQARRGPARLQGELRQDPRRARLRDL